MSYYSGECFWKSFSTQRCSGRWSGSEEGFTPRRGFISVHSGPSNGQDWDNLSWMEAQKTWDGPCISCLSCPVVSTQQHNTIGIGAEFVREISFPIHKCRSSVRFILFSWITWCPVWPLWSDGMPWCPSDNCSLCRCLLDIFTENPGCFSTKLQCLNFP